MQSKQKHQISLAEDLLLERLPLEVLPFLNLCLLHWP
jgi:hypothetical protein